LALQKPIRRRAFFVTSAEVQSFCSRVSRSGVRQVLALVGEAVADREHDRLLDPGRVELADQRRAVPFGHFHDRREGGVDQMLVIVDERRRARSDRSGSRRCCASGEEQHGCKGKGDFHGDTLRKNATTVSLEAASAVRAGSCPIYK
jgi:hypothetical protein